jgi:predicted N-acetyltransferase YhbS
MELRENTLINYRSMQPADLDTLTALWQQVFGDSAEYAQQAVCRLAGEQNTYVAEQDGALAGMVLAIPVTLGNKNGVCLGGLAVKPACRGQGIASGLVEYVCAARKAEGDRFAVLIPAEASLFSWYEKQGFQRAFAMRHIHRPIRRNIWSQAEFDSTPAKKLCELRARFCPNAVLTNPEEMVQILTDLYSRGVTVVSSEEGYGLYFREGETLKFIELMAEGDRAAECLMEAAREKEVVVEDADIWIGDAQNLFLGEGTREDYGMIRFLGAPLDITESYLRLILDV